MHAESRLLLVSLVCFLYWPSSFVFGAEDEIDIRDYCTFAQLFVRRHVEDDLGADSDVRKEGSCEVKVEGDMRTVTATYSTKLSRQSNSPHLQYEVTFKMGEFMGKYRFSLCSLRHPVDTLVEKLDC